MAGSYLPEKVVAYPKTPSNQLASDKAAALTLRILGSPDSNNSNNSLTLMELILTLHLNQLNLLQ